MSELKITILHNGPVKIEGENITINMPDGSVLNKEGKVSICRCGSSNKKPFCDGTHKTCDFEG